MVRGEGASCHMFALNWHQVIWELTESMQSFTMGREVSWCCIPLVGTDDQACAGSGWVTGYASCGLAEHLLPLLGQVANGDRPLLLTDLIRTTNLIFLKGPSKHLKGHCQLICWHFVIKSKSKVLVHSACYKLAWKPNNPLRASLEFFD